MTDLALPGEDEVDAARDPDVVPLATAAVHARFRPRVVVAVWIAQGVLAVLGTWPAAALARAAYGDHPRGDAPLWEPGAHALFDLVDRNANGVRAAAGTATATLVLGALLGLVPAAALLVSMSHATREGRGIGAARTTGRALRVVPSLALLLLAALVAQGLAVGGGIFCADLAEAWSHRALGEAGAQLLATAVAVPWVVAVLGAGVVHDLARAAVVRRGLRGFPALAAGTRVFRAAPLVVGWSWAWRAAAGLAPIAVVGAVAQALGARAPVAGGALLALAVLHQSVILGRTALHASWLARALRAVSAVSAVSVQRASER